MRRSYNNTDSRTDFLEVTRRLYRGVTDIAKRLDEQKNSALSIADVFTPEGETLRAKLKDYCERLIFKDPVGHAKKIEELLWRRGFYDAVSAAKKLKKGNSWNDNEKALLSTHLAVGVGFYHHLILRLQLECGLNLAGVVDFAFPSNKCGLPSREKSATVKILSEETRQCALRIVHRSLICLGDLARYKLDVDPNWDPMIAVRYYKIAINIDPNVGMSHNQLGTVSGNKNYGIDAVYHYLRCILCPEPFEGAEGNLRRIISTHFFYGKEKLPSQRCAARLFTLLQRWDGNTPNIDQINEECQNLLTDIENCLKMEKSESTTAKDLKQEDSIGGYLNACKNEQAPYLTDDVVFKMTAICLMSISKLQSKESLQLHGVIAFILSVLSKLIEVTIIRLEESVIGTSLLAKKELAHNSAGNGDKEMIEYEKNGDEMIMKSSSDVDVNDNKNSSSAGRIANGNLNGNVSKPRNKSRNLLSKLRRPRKRINSSDSDGSDIDGTHIGSSSEELNSDISETEEEDILSEGNEHSDDLTDEENEKVDNDTVQSEKENGFVDEKVEELGKKTEIPENGDESVIYGTNGEETEITYIAELKKPNVDPKEHLETLSKEGLLQSIKICFDWLRGNTEVLKLAAKSSQTLLHRITVLLNFINIDTEALLKNPDRESTFCINLEKLNESAKLVPLPEDNDLKGLDVLKISHENLDWQILRNVSMNQIEETLLRSLKFINFGNFLCTIEESGVKFDEKKGLYIVVEPKEIDAVKEEERIEEETESDHPRGKLMRHMGKLWLKAEVRALESSLKSKLMSPYLVPDHEALAKHMPLLKRLVHTKKFIVVIPSIVVSGLDEVKKTSSRAREATRWLEDQLRKGSRFLRAQRPQERLPLPYIKGPRSKDKEAWSFFQIIECCHYLTQQTKVSFSSDADPPVVTFLTGVGAEERKSSSFSPDGLARSAGVNLEHIESFHTKWKTSSKSHG